VKQLMRSVVYGTGVALALASCGGSSTGGKNDIHRIPVPESAFKPTALESTIGSLVDEINKTESTEAQLGILLKELVGYWEPVKTGANRAIGELKVPGAVVAPADATPDERAASQKLLMANQNSSGSYTGFGLAPLKADITDTINAAVDAGNPVITIDSDLPESKRQLYVGTINPEAGKTAANTLIHELGSVSTGTVVILGHDNAEDWPDGYQRTMGAKTVLETRGFTVVIRKSTWTETGDAEDSESMRDTIATADPAVVGMIGLFSNAHRCAKAAELASKTGTDIAIVAFDFDPKTLNYMQTGFIRATHVQRQYYMGYIVPYLLYGVNALGMEKTKQIMAPHMVDSARIDSGLDVVGADKVDEYNAFLDSLGIGAS
jgi:ribose transport system substrate-binding protein